VKLAATRVRVPPVELDCSRPKAGSGRGREAKPESTIQTEPSGRNDSEPHLMSLERANREPSRYLNGEGCHAETTNVPRCR